MPLPAHDTCDPSRCCWHDGPAATGIVYQHGREHHICARCVPKWCAYPKVHIVRALLFGTPFPTVKRTQEPIAHLG